MKLRTRKDWRFLPERHNWPFWTYDPWHKVLCFVTGHVPTPDQCDLPEHDYCGWCTRSMPLAAHRETP